ncbi:hypothetical protein Hypma_006280 [Hypsizygus marmoreus]|uniref:DUF1996 domain-containing protein n=1 Tax=Hypsizygus marmoreus TaxID=39966 RepID=A0A369K0V8_HYPMA|nr:hypothetical protein Hypma_006280 [Hypsizygus marmoreus]
MARHVMKSLVLLTALTSANAYWLMGIENFITTERLDPIVNPGKVSGHVHSVLGGSNFRMNTNTADLRKSECTSVPIPQDKSNYWFPHLYFQWSNGDFSSLSGGAVICKDASYLCDKPGTTTAFPDDFRMLSGDPTLRTYDPNSFAQQAITFLCLDFNGVTTKHNSLPTKACPSGIRAQVNFPSCWDGKNLDSPDHKSHVAFLSGGPDSGSCSDPKFPVTLPRIFIEVYWNTGDFDKVRSQAMNQSQPFVYAYGDPTGFGYHADFINGWDAGVLQKAVDNCHCNPYGDPTCCVNQGIFDMTKGKQCRITKNVDEQTTGRLSKLPGNNPVQKEGVKATLFSDPNVPTLLSPVYAYTGDTPTVIGKPVPPASGGPQSSSVATSSASSVSTPSSAPQPSSSIVVTPSSSIATPSSTPSKPTTPTEGSTSSVAPSSPTPSKPTTLTEGSTSSVVVTPSSVDAPQPPSQAPSSPSEPASPTASVAPSSSAAPAPRPTSSSTVIQPSAPVTTAPNPVPTTRTSSSVAAPTPSSSADTAPPSPSAPLPPSSGHGSNNPPNVPPHHAPNPGHPHHSDSHPVHVPHSPAATLIVDPGNGNAAPHSPAPTGISSPSHDALPVCAGGKYRHKHLKERRGLRQSQKRSIHHVRSLHESGRRFMKPHAHVHAF